MNDNRTPERHPTEDMVLLLGELKGMVQSIKEDVDEVKEAMASDRVESSASRRRMYDKLDGVDRRLTKMESTVTVMGGVVEKQTNRINAIEPVVKSTASAVRQWALRWGMITAALGGMGGMLWFLFTANWQELYRLVVQFFPPPQ